MFHLRALPIDRETLLLEHSLVFGASHADEPHSPQDLEAKHLSADGVIVQCSYCRRVRAGAADTWADTWHWVPAWVPEAPSHTSHGVCPVCVGLLLAEKPVTT